MELLRWWHCNLQCCWRTHRLLTETHTAMKVPTDYEIHTLFREWYKATTNHDPDTQQTTLYSQFARAVLNKATSPVDDYRFGGTD